MQNLKKKFILICKTFSFVVNLCHPWRYTFCTCHRGSIQRSQHKGYRIYFYWFQIFFKNYLYSIVYMSKGDKANCTGLTVVCALVSNNNDLALHCARSFSVVQWMHIKRQGRRHILVTPGNLRQLLITGQR